MANIKNLQNAITYLDRLTYDGKTKQDSLDQLIKAFVAGINKEEITRSGRYSRRVEARSVLCYWASRELGMS